MPEKTIRITNRLITELRDYCFEQSGDFKDGTAASLILKKDVAQPSIEVPAVLQPKYAGYMGMTCFTLMAMREGRKKPVYEFNLRVLVERLLDHIPDPLEYVLDEDMQAYLEQEMRSNESNVTETQSVNYEVSSDEPGVINIAQHYGVEVDSSEVYGFDEEEFYGGLSGTTVEVTTEPKNGRPTYLWITDPIPSERLENESDRFENAREFSSILDPDQIGSYDPPIPFEVAAARMRKSLRQMRTGRLKI